MLLKNKTSVDGGAMHFLSSNYDLALKIQIKACDQLEKGAFPATAWPNNADEFPLLNGKI
ncbi:hypothetical protein D1872_290520 [compost metagenome]